MTPPEGTTVPPDSGVPQADVESRILDRVPIRQPTHPRVEEIVPVDAIRADIARVMEGDSNNAKFRLTRLYEAALRKSERKKAILYLEKLLEMDSSRDLHFELGKLHFLTGEIKRSYWIFKALCDTPQTPEETREHFLWLYKAWKAIGSSEETFALCEQDIALVAGRQTRAPGAFDDIVQMYELARYFLSGHNPYIGKDEGSTESGYERTVRLGETLAPFQDLRIEAERRKLLGAAYLHMARDMRESELPYFRRFAPDEKERSRKTLMEKLLKAEEHSVRAIGILQTFPADPLETEGDDLLRAMYNLAYTFFLKSATYPKSAMGYYGEQRGLAERFHSNAEYVIGQLHILSERAQDPLFRGSAHLLRGDLLRYGASETPERHHLQAALFCNQEAMDTGSQNPELVLSVLLNVGEILADLGEIPRARTYAQQAADKFFAMAGENQRLRELATEPLRRLGKRLGIVIKIP